ncbi:uncharacterized protein TNCV_4240011 [Trichonephila clavipes]|nr:uncharacterized protein TNCV_4240011 [Trichonephila clavipes]
MPSIGGYHPYGLASILTGLESIEHVWDMLGRRIAAHQPLPLFYWNFGGHCLMRGVIFPKIRLIILYSACLGVVTVRQSATMLFKYSHYTVSPCITFTVPLCGKITPQKSISNLFLKDLCGKFPHEHSLEGSSNATTNELTRETGIQRAEVDDPGLKKSDENGGRVGTHHPLFTRETFIAIIQDSVMIPK